jgi:hypothetical protein
MKLSSPHKPLKKQWISGSTSHGDGVQLIAEQRFQVMSWATAQYTVPRSDCPGDPRVSRLRRLSNSAPMSRCASAVDCKKNGVVPGWDDAVKNITRSRGLPHECTEINRSEIDSQDERTTFVTNAAVDITQAITTTADVSTPRGNEPSGGKVWPCEHLQTAMICYTRP